MKIIVIIIGALRKGSFSRKLVEERSLSLSFRAKPPPVISSEARRAESRNLTIVRVKQAKASPRTEGRSPRASLSRDDKGLVEKFDY